MGVDILPAKTCSFDCLYCQLGRTRRKTFRRIRYADTEQLKKELSGVLASKPRIDYLTIAGSGEPTLHKGLDKIIAALKDVSGSKIPVCVITNSSLLWRADVRKELREADLIIPSLDAAGEAAFKKLNCPVKGITAAKIIAGLVKLRREFKGKIWLEIMVVAGMNDAANEIRRLKTAVEQINPDKIQLNIPVRPSWVKIRLPSRKTLEDMKRILGNKTEIVGSFSGRRQKRMFLNTKDTVSRFIRTRPATLQDLILSLGLDRRKAEVFLKELARDSIVKAYNRLGEKYYAADDQG